MKLFNAFQLICFFALSPLLIQYTHTAEFYAHNVAFWVLLIAYLWGFAGLVFCVGEQL